MNENSVALLQQYEQAKREHLTKAITARKNALTIVMNNLAKDCDGTPQTAQDVKAVYVELIAKLYSELQQLN